MGPLNRTSTHFPIGIVNIFLCISGCEGKSSCVHSALHSQFWNPTRSWEVRKSLTTGILLWNTKINIYFSPSQSPYGAQTPDSMLINICPFRIHLITHWYCRCVCLNTNNVRKYRIFIIRNFKIEKKASMLTWICVMLISDYGNGYTNRTTY